MKKLIPVSSRLALLFLLVLPFSLMTSASITVKDHGVRPLQPGDVSMIFYAKVSNRNSVPQRVRLNMSQCCLILPDSSEDCESMKLLAGLEGDLKPKAYFDLTMYYIAENLYNRRGTCVLKVLSRPGDKKAFSNRLKRREVEVSSEITVSFNTSLPKATLIDQIHFQLGGSKDGYTLCNTPHLDPERNCQEDNCLLRFSGHRSFFHKESQLCQSTSKCTSNDKQVISPVTGKCIEIPSAVNISSFPEITKYPLEINLLEGLSRSEYIEKPSNSSEISAHILSLTSTMPRMKCVNGNKTHFGCICNEGWTSVDLNSSTHSNSSVIEEFSLCNILTDEGKLLERARRHRDNVIVLSIMLGTLCIVGAFGILWLLYNRVGRLGYNALKEEKDNEDVFPEDVINEIAHRRESTVNPKFSPSPSDPQLLNISTTQLNNTSSKSSQLVISRESKHGNSSTGTNQQEGALASSQSNPGNTAHSTVSTRSFITSTRANTDFSERESLSGLQSSEESYPDYEGLVLTPSTETNSSAVDIDTLISLSHHEKLRTKSEPVLFPFRVKEIDPRKTQSTYKYPQSSPRTQITAEDLANNNNTIVSLPTPASSTTTTSGTDSSSISRELDSSSSGHPSLVDNTKVFELNTSQKQEEWEKFLKFFTTCKISRRRSLCSTPEEQVQEALRHIRDEMRAHKTHSMPALRSTNPFINYTADVEEMSTFTKSAKSSSTDRSTNTDESSSSTGGSSCTSVWSSHQVTSLSDINIASSSSSCESSSDDYMSISIYPKLFQAKECNSNKVPGKNAANFHVPFTQQPSQSTSDTNVHIGENLAGSFRYGSSDTDPYALTAKLKEVLRASKSRSLDSIIKNTLEQRK